MTPPEEVLLPTPDPSPEVTDITAEQERLNNIAAAYRKSIVTSAERDIALAQLHGLDPTPTEIRAALATWQI